MKKHFKLIDLDCANCAAKMEAAIKKLDGVHDATVSFMTQKLTLDADDTRFDEILNEVHCPAEERHHNGAQGRGQMGIDPLHAQLGQDGGHSRKERGGKGI